MTFFDRFNIHVGAPIGGIPIRIHWSFVGIFLLLVLLTIPKYKSFSATFLYTILYGPVLLITILTHEYGHAYMNKKLGGEAIEIVLWPLGGLAFLGPTDGPVMDTFWVAIAGPLTHLPQMIVWFSLYLLISWFDLSDFRLLSDPGDADVSDFRAFLLMLCELSVYLNVVVFVFNQFTPAYPLDCGQQLAALLVSKFGKTCVEAAILVSTISGLVGASIVIAGLCLLMFRSSSSGAAGDILFMAVGAWIIMEAWQLRAVAIVPAQHGGRQIAIYQHPFFSRPCYRRSDDERLQRGRQQQRDQARRDGGIPNVRAPEDPTMMEEMPEARNQSSSSSGKAAAAEEQQPNNTGGGSSFISRMLGRRGGGGGSG